MEANNMNPDQTAPLRPIEMRANILLRHTFLKDPRIIP